MKKWMLALCAVLLLIGCSAADLVSSGASSQAVSHAVSIPGWMEEDYQTTGKYDFRVPERTLVEYIMAVPDFLDAGQQSLYAAAIEAYRAFAVKPGFRPDESQTYPTDLPYNYVRETAFADSADLADYLRSLFDLNCSSSCTGRMSQWTVRRFHRTGRHWWGSRCMLNLTAACTCWMLDRMKTVSIRIPSVLNWCPEPRMRSCSNPVTRTARAVRCA